MGFADDDFPIEEMRYASFLVFRETSDEERASGAGNYFVLKKWTKLPRNVAFKRVAGSLVADSGGQTFPGLNAACPPVSRMQHSCLAFNCSGALMAAATRFSSSFMKATTTLDRTSKREKGGDLFEKISLSRYTGRAEFDVTASNIQ